MQSPIGTMLWFVAAVGSFALLFFFGLGDLGSATAAETIGAPGEPIEPSNIIALSICFSLSAFGLYRATPPARVGRAASIAGVVLLGALPGPWMLAIGLLVPMSRHVMSAPIVLATVTSAWAVALLAMRLVDPAGARASGLPGQKLVLLGGVPADAPAGRYLDPAPWDDRRHPAPWDDRRDRVDPEEMIRWIPRAEHRLAAWVHRSMDVAVAVLLLVVFAPVMLLVAAIVAADSPGPILYRQERVGLNGVPFTILKFRSMREDAERDGVARFAQVGDSRVTRVGRVLRLTRLDELPQLFNILGNSMSVVGPRPERPDFVERYRLSIPAYDVRHVVKPGLTGWAQVRYPYAATDAETRAKLSYDLFYVRNRSVAFDLRIMVSTIQVIMTQAGAR